jgi:hypothetical protein
MQSSINEVLTAPAPLKYETLVDFQNRTYSVQNIDVIVTNAFNNGDFGLA